MSPAPVYEIIKIQKIHQQRDYYEISLRVGNNVKKDDSNIDLLTDIHKKVHIEKDIDVLENLKDKEFIQSLEKLRGNNLIKSFLFRNFLPEVNFAELLIEALKKMPNVEIMRLLYFDEIMIDYPRKRTNYGSLKNI